MTNPKKLDNVLIVGAGWVGRQIAARMAQYGLRVTLVDTVPSICQDALEWMRTLPAVEHGGSTPPGTPPSAQRDWQANVSTVTSVEGLSSAQRAAVDLAIECVPEQISVKKRVLRALSAHFPPPTIIASNSSYFVPSMLSAFVADPTRFAHLHFHVPVLRDSVADIVGCESTEPAVIASLSALVRHIGHEPLVLRREHPGYIFNWLLQSVLKSALELAALDVADPETIDKSWKAVTGMPLGPFGIMDQIGLDVIEQVLSNARWAPVDQRVDTQQLLVLLSRHTDRGHLGTKTQRGFYDYSETADLKADQPKAD